MDKWLRRRIRMCIWKSWKKPSTRVKNLVKCGIKPYLAYQWGNSSSGYWRIAGSPIMSRAANDKNLRIAGYPCLMDYYVKLHWTMKNRRMPNGTYGGVRGRKTKVGGNYFCFPPTRYIYMLFVRFRRGSVSIGKWGSLWIGNWGSFCVGISIQLLYRKISYRYAICVTVILVAIYALYLKQQSNIKTSPIIDGPFRQSTV